LLPKTPPPTFKFLTTQRPCHEYTWNKESSTGALTVYSFPAYHSTIYHAARQELLLLGYTEITPPIDYDSTGQRLDPRDRNVSSIFEKQTGRTHLNIRIAKGRFLEARPDGGMRFTADLDWDNKDLKRASGSSGDWSIETIEPIEPIEAPAPVDDPKQRRIDPVYRCDTNEYRMSRTCFAAEAFPYLDAVVVDGGAHRSRKASITSRS